MTQTSFELFGDIIYAGKIIIQILCFSFLWKIAYPMTIRKSLSCIWEKKDFFKVIFSSIVRKVSNTRNSEFKLYMMAQKSLDKFHPNVFKEFDQKYRENYRMMCDFYESYTNCDVIILDEDSRYKTSLADNSVDLIVTSPPYGDSKTTVAYGQFSRLSLQWMDFNKKVTSSIDNICLGGKPRGQEFDIILQSPTLKDISEKIRIVDEKRSDDVLAFFNDFYSCINEFDRIVKNQGICVLLLVTEQLRRHIF